MNGFMVPVSASYGYPHWVRAIWLFVAYYREPSVYVLGPAEFYDDSSYE